MIRYQEGPPEDVHEDLQVPKSTDEENQRKEPRASPRPRTSGHDPAHPAPGASSTIAAQPQKATGPGHPGQAARTSGLSRAPGHPAASPEIRPLRTREQQMPLLQHGHPPPHPGHPVSPESPDIRPDQPGHPAPDSINSILHSVYRLTFVQFCSGAHIHFRIPPPLPHSTTIAFPATNSDNFDPFCFENLSCDFRVLLCFGYLVTVRQQHHHRSSSPRTTTNSYITLASPHLGITLVS